MSPSSACSAFCSTGRTPSRWMVGCVLFFFVFCSRAVACVCLFPFLVCALLTSCVLHCVLLVSCVLVCAYVLVCFRPSFVVFVCVLLVEDDGSPLIADSLPSLMCGERWYHTCNSLQCTGKSPSSWARSTTRDLIRATRTTRTASCPSSTSCWCTGPGPFPPFPLFLSFWSPRSLAFARTHTQSGGCHSGPQGDQLLGLLQAQQHPRDPPPGCDAPFLFPPISPSPLSLCPCPMLTHLSAHSLFCRMARSKSLPSTRRTGWVSRRWTSPAA